MLGIFCGRVATSGVRAVRDTKIVTAALEGLSGAYGLSCAFLVRSLDLTRTVYPPELRAARCTAFTRVRHSAAARLALIGI